MENNSQAIEIKGIVRNQTKIGVQDGQCDDIVNLRFKDGSWRVADDGKMIVNSAGTPFSVYPYTQLYVHTNVYHHLLGVTDGKLWWFANIDADNETFSYVTDSKGDPDAIEICDVQGDVTIVQNGHLLTIISTASSVTTPLPLATSTEDVIKYAIFKTDTNEYKVLKVDKNGEQTDRELYPFGRVHLNLDCEAKTFTKKRDRESEAFVELGDNSINASRSSAIVPRDNEKDTHAAAQIWHADMLELFKNAKDENYFTQPFLAMVALKLYDGSYTYATAPILLSPREKYSYGKTYFEPNTKVDISSAYDVSFCLQGYYIKYDENNKPVDADNSTFAYSLVESIGVRVNTTDDRVPVYCSFAGSKALIGEFQSGRNMTSQVIGSSIVLTLGDLYQVIENKDVFQSVCVFITPQVDMYDLSAEGYKKGSVMTNFETDGQNYKCGNVFYSPFVRPYEECIYELLHSNFYLLKEYTIEDIEKNKLYNTSFIVDLSSADLKNILNNLTVETNDILTSISSDRSSFLPKTAYMYNQKLHIANYKTTQFHGYPIDSFQFSNHSVKVEKGSYAVGGVLPNLKDGVDVQYPRTQYPFMNRLAETFDQYIQVSKDKGYCFASIRVIIETQQGDQQVVRYIQPYEAHKFTNGDNANFVESLGALLLFPDYRAKEMEVAVICLHEGRVYRRSKTFKLTPHTYLNIAYYINPQLKPIDLPVTGSPTGVEFDDFITNSQIGLFVTPSERNNTEYYPNGLKVSEVNNPFTFPHESTYQVGSSEIVALMSNTVAVGTGQTGDAPLYVFCKDGIYILIVDPSGTMTYTNQPPIARDVCNNAKSVTPIDNGVVFTSDRGLMSIAGDKVIEIGSAAEGDVFDITDTSDKAKKIMFNVFTMQQFAEFSQSLIDNTDFLTYIKGAIVNYNHNERELMVSNPDKDYTYVMDRNGNWSRRAFTAQEYVNNYPTSYRIDKAGNFYKVDADDNETNKVYLLSNVIKLGTIAFKQAYRLVVRGYFETTAAKLGLYVFGSYDGRQWALLGGNERDGQFTDIGCKISHTDIRFLRVCLAGKLSKDARIDYIEVSADGSALNGKLR